MLLFRYLFCFDYLYYSIYYQFSYHLRYNIKSANFSVNVFLTKHFPRLYAWAEHLLLTRDVKNLLHVLTCFFNWVNRWRCCVLCSNMFTNIDRWKYEKSEFKELVDLSQWCNLYTRSWKLFLKIKLYTATLTLNTYFDSCVSRIFSIYNLFTLVTLHVINIFIN